jgi:hypothetical protein
MLYNTGDGKQEVKNKKGEVHIDCADRLKA